MKTLYYIPIEPLSERYTEQWYTYFPKEFQKEFNVEIIDGIPLSDTVNVGTFLDINSTIAYKNSQMIKIAKLFQENKVQDDSVFFFGDLEFWGIESLRLMADMNNIKIKLYAYLHAASYVEKDAFQIAEDYQKYTELGWVLAMDKVFIATNHHKKLFMKTRGTLAAFDDYQKLEKKFKVVGNPLFMDAYKNYNQKKKNKILCTNRPDTEKMVDVTMEIFKVLKKENPDWEFVMCTGRKYYKSNNPKIEKQAKELEQEGIITIKSNLSKDEYHKELSEAKVVVTNNEIEETFGYCPMEAALYNAAPICPNLLSHPELLENNKELLYTPGNYKNCIDKIKNIMTNPLREYKHYTDKYNSNKVIQKMIEEMK